MENSEIVFEEETKILEAENQLEEISNKEERSITLENNLSVETVEQEINLKADSEKGLVEKLDNSQLPLTTSGILSCFLFCFKIWFDMKMHTQLKNY